MPVYAGVVIEAPLTTVYHYRVPEDKQSQVVSGARVTVPLGRGNRKVNGFCVSVSNDCPIDPKRVKDIASVSPAEECVPADLLALCRWIGEYYRSGWGQVLAAAIPAGVRASRRASRDLWLSLAQPVAESRAAAVKLERRAPKQAAALNILCANAEQGGAEWAEASAVEAQSGASRPTLRALAKRKLIRLEERLSRSPLAGLPEAEKDITPTADQTAAINTIGAALEKRYFQPFLLYGVTGSGKTEVYLRALEHARGMDRSVLVLVPEISLTPQTVERFRRRAGDVAVLHSRMTDGERAEAWHAIRSGQVRVVVGARSAIFAPLDNLGLIIVDEEHERSFKQDNDPRYHARDVAIVRAKETRAVVILGSATPSLASWRNAEDGKYQLLELPTRVGGASPPTTAVVDLREEWAELKRPVLVSRELERAVMAALSREEQVILFLNRRGFNTFVQCRACGEPVRCRDCDIAMSHHRGEGVLKCHHCGYTINAPRQCTLCGAEALHYAGTGTERGGDVAASLFPDARILRMDSDTMSGRDAHAEALGAFSRGEYDILLGTQMVAKGLDFPNVTVVGVLAADSALNLPDFRASERTFQLITQVVGRAGRADKPGRAIIQAYQPEHPSVDFATRQDFSGFAQHELRERQETGYPPFGRIARVILRGPKLPLVTKAADALAEALRGAAPRPLMVLGPAECSIARLQGDHRWHVMIKTRNHREAHRMLDACSDALAPRKGIRVAIDIDAQSML